jgi:hypothetical protein
MVPANKLNKNSVAWPAFLPRAVEFQRGRERSPLFPHRHNGAGAAGFDMALESIGNLLGRKRLAFIKAVTKFIDEIAEAFLLKRGFIGIVDKALGGGFVHDG